jgi:hypothetical protein
MKKKGRKSKTFSQSSSGSESVGDKSKSNLEGKKKTLLEKLDCLSEGLLICRNSYLQILSAMADGNSKKFEDIQRQILALKESISGPERKKIKKVKLADELTGLNKIRRKLRLKPELGRNKDLGKIENFLLHTYRTLDSINDKILAERESPDQPETQETHPQDFQVTSH